MRILSRNQSYKILEKFLTFFDIKNASEIASKFVSSKMVNIGPISIQTPLGKILPNLYFSGGEFKSLDEKFERGLAVDNIEKRDDDFKISKYDFAKIIINFLTSIKANKVYIICDNFSSDKYIGKVVEMHPSEIPEIIGRINVNGYIFDDSLKWVYSIHSNEYSYFFGTDKAIQNIYQIEPNIADFTFAPTDE